ncbi:pilus assembly protein PilP [Photobacterium rosenbergii]|uniref:Pilus assembly protein PilP n=1 Tax=Photobacterium rosenbergii TaxID=294936 RepID=A0ABU3ZMH1_9GAMM|nr:pilus assembly protein PilP [Photobacterium rosenbergii]MDV5171234.1 pilus assembly protein PilP [Photobacterium rosenbergii]
MKSTDKSILALGLWLGLMGCQANEDSVELFINQTYQRAVARVEPLDEQPVFKAEVFVMSSQRVPFQQPKPEVAVPEREDGKVCWQPELRQRSSPLESFSLDQLSMRGVIGGAGKEWALIYTPEGILAKVRVGSYIGRNHGRVMEVTADKVAIEQIMPDGEGCWLKLPATLKLASLEVPE